MPGKIQLTLLALLTATQHLVLPVQAQQASETAIDRYVKRPDTAFQWTIVNEQTSGDIASIVVDMTSQNWLTQEQVDRTQWKHWVNIAIPSEIRNDCALLMIAGGSNRGEPPASVSEEIAQIAKATGSIVAELKMVPNQPLTFHGDGVPRKEDDLIGYTWDQYLETGDAEWLARNAMVKSAVRAMDTVQQVAQKSRKHSVERFVVAGGSKRGWTTWLTGAMDERVVGIVPIVIDVLNVGESMKHHFAAYGYWAPSVGNYVHHRIMQRLDHPRIDELYDLVDPYAYRHRLTMPKLILNAAGDQFFLPDSSRFYFDELPGQNSLRYVPNTDHGLGNSDAVQSIIAFYHTIAYHVQRPQIQWQFGDGGTIRVTADTEPKEVLFWQASNPGARDFRLETLGAKYESSKLTASEDGSYSRSLDSPDKGWTAGFIELTFDVGAAVPLKLTTAVRVAPDTLPYADRDPALPTSLTIKVRLESEDKGTELMTQATMLMKQKMAIEDVRNLQEGNAIYLNWVAKDFWEEAGPVVGWFESKAGVENISVQLESGRNITTTAKN